MVTPRWRIRETDPDTVARELAVFDLASRFFDECVPLTYPIFGADGHDARPCGFARFDVIGATAHELGDDLLRTVRTDRSIKGIADMVLLDLVTQNADRHGNNWLVGQHGAIWAIDNELAMGNTHPGRRWALRPAYRACLLDDMAWTRRFGDHLVRRIDMLSFDRRFGDALAELDLEFDVKAAREWASEIACPSSTGII